MNKLFQLKINSFLFFKLFFLISLFHSEAWAKNVDISWEPKKDIDSYNVYIYNHDNQNEIFKYLNVKSNKASFEITGPGRYDFKIVPVFGLTEYPSSASTGSVIAKYEAVEINIADEEIKWNGPRKAAGYTVLIKNKDQTNTFETKKPSFSKFKARSGDIISVTANDENNQPISEVGVLEFSSQSNKPKNLAFSISYNQNSVTSSVLSSEVTAGKITSFNAYELQVSKKINFDPWTSEFSTGHLALKGSSGFIPIEGQLTRNGHFLFSQDFGAFIQRSNFILNYTDRLSQSVFLRYGVIWRILPIEKLVISLRQGISFGKIESLEPGILYKLNPSLSFFVTYYQTVFNVYDTSTKILAVEYKNQEAKLGLKFSF